MCQIGLSKEHDSKHVCSKAYLAVSAQKLLGPVSQLILPLDIQACVLDSKHVDKQSAWHRTSWKILQTCQAPPARPDSNRYQGELIDKLRDWSPTSNSQLRLVWKKLGRKK